MALKDWKREKMTHGWSILLTKEPNKIIAIGKEGKYFIISKGQFFG